ncbi:MAG: transposase [Rhabdochlamydiaceae bacterium]|jgi:IS5 family transposase
MLKIHCLQQWYQLSDPGMEEAIYDRVSFQRFLRLDSFMERVPDETTILSFRHLLEEHHLGRNLRSSQSKTYRKRLVAERRNNKGKEDVNGVIKN